MRTRETLTPVIYIDGDQQEFHFELALQYNDGYSDNILSLSIMSVLRTEELTKQDLSLPLPRLLTIMHVKQVFSKKKIRTLKGQITVRAYQQLSRFWFLKNTFSLKGQTKDKLGSPFLARPIVDSIVSEHLTYFLMGKWGLSF